MTWEKKTLSRKNNFLKLRKCTKTIFANFCTFSKFSRVRRGLVGFVEVTKFGKGNLLNNYN